ncbi:MAG: ECF transporter S component [Lactobacillus sp.]|nr:ECF transporter S component [Lactobacillus sp.]
MKRKWDLRAIILVALIGIFLGLVYTYAFNNIYNILKLILAPTGYASIVDAALSGLWYIAAPLAIYFVPVLGSGVIGEVIAGVVEMAVGGQWGILTIVSAICQGGMNELGFVGRYEKFGWTNVLLGATLAHIGGFVSSYFIYGWNNFKIELQLAMFVVGLISSLLFDGVMVKMITTLCDEDLKSE